MEPNIITKEMKERMLNQIGAVVKKRAMEKCPVDQGALRASIDFEIVDEDTVVIFADAEGAKEMEYGKPPEPLNQSEKDELEKWAERHGASPKGMIRYIEEHGIKVGTAESPMHITSFGRNSYRPYLRPAVHQSKADIKKIIARNLGS